MSVFLAGIDMCTFFCSVLAVLWPRNIGHRSGIHLGPEIRQQIGHPVIDGDSHLIEYMPVYLDYLRDAGADDRLIRMMRRSQRGSRWYSQSEAERRHNRTLREPWWALPTEQTHDRMTAMLPKLFYERLDEIGLDLAIIYPSAGMRFPAAKLDEPRQLACHAYNEYVADLFAPYRDRLIPAALIPMHTPDEAMRELDHAHRLGLKVALIPSFVQRPVPAAQSNGADPQTAPTWLDAYGLDSDHDYDPFWARCVELNIPISSHSRTLGLDERRSISNYMFNHMGSFAAAGDILAKSLMLGGVVQRFPDLRIALLEGGVTNGVRLLSDLVSHWEKRGADHIQTYDPGRLDSARATSLFDNYADDRHKAKSGRLTAAMSLGGQTDQLGSLDEFAAMQVTSPSDIVEQFTNCFYFGCEADDPLASLGFDQDRIPDRGIVKAMLTLDLGHWDVADMSLALVEAYEQIDKGLMTEADFHQFSFGHAVQFYSGGQPDFFADTIVAEQAISILGESNDI